MWMWFVILNIWGMLWLIRMIGMLCDFMFWISFRIWWFFLMFKVVVGLLRMIILDLKVVVCVIVMF